MCLLSRAGLVDKLEGTLGGLEAPPRGLDIGSSASSQASGMVGRTRDGGQDMVVSDVASSSSCGGPSLGERGGGACGAGGFGFGSRDGGGHLTCSGRRGEDGLGREPSDLDLIAARFEGLELRSEAGTAVRACHSGAAARQAVARSSSWRWTPREAPRGNG